MSTPEQRAKWRAAKRDRRNESPAAREKRLARVKQYALENKAKIEARKKVWRAANLNKVKSREKKQTLKKYGLTPVEYDSMLQSQSGVCAICKKSERAKDSRRLAVDHCHTTGRVRGLLCGPCNRILGLAKDSEDVLESAKQYLRLALI